MKRQDVSLPGVWISALIASLALTLGCGGASPTVPTGPSTAPVPPSSPPPPPAPAPAPAPIEPAALAALSVTPGTVDSQDSSEGRVTLTREAPDGGAVVALTSSKVDVARTPATVTVTAGASSATFPITTATVGNASSTVIGASYQGVTQTATLSVRPPGLTAAFKVYKVVADFCQIVDSSGAVDCIFDASASRGFPTRFLWTVTVAGNRLEFSSTRNTVTPSTTCGLFAGARLNPLVVMEVALRVEREGQISSNTATRTVTLGSDRRNADGSGFCGIPGDW